MSIAIHQVLAGFRQNDAISNEALCLQAVFRAWGLPSDIAVDLPHTEMQPQQSVRDAATLGRELRPGDIVLLHLSSATPLNAWFAGLACRKVIRYHNVTPPDFFRGIDSRLAERLADGHRQVAALAGAADLNLAVSGFNAADLAAMGYEKVAVFPLALDFSMTRLPPDETTRLRLDDGALNLLFVGRCVPNKRFESLLRVLHALERTPGRHCRLLLAGPYEGAEVYYSTLLAQARALALRDVRFLGALSQAQLNACYAAANVFVCMSEHEGFCVPLLEAMAHGLPIVALKRAAVPETLGPAGIQFERADFALIAEMIRGLDEDPVLRQAVCAAQRKRLDVFLQRDVAAELRKHLAPLLPASMGAG